MTLDIFIFEKLSRLDPNEILVLRVVYIREISVKGFQGVPNKF